MRYILFLIALFCYTSSIPVLGISPKSELRLSQNLSSSISGKVNNQGSFDKVGLQFYKDYISLDQEYFEIPIDFNGEFSMNFKLAEPTLVLFSFGSDEVELYVEPGDEIHLAFSGMDLFNSIKFEGKGALHNTFLKEFNEKFKNWSDAFIDYEILTKSAWEFRRFIGGVHSSKWNFLKNFKDRRTFSPTFSQYIYAEIDYWWAYHLMRYRTERMNMENEQVNDQYFDFLNQVLISNENALINQNYLYFLDQYLLFINSGYADLEKFPKEERMKVIAPSMIIMSRPDGEPIIGQAKQGDFLKYLNKKSDFTSQTLIGDRIKEEHWYRILTTAKEVGWVLGGGVQFESLLKENKVEKNFEEYSTLKFKNIGKYLHGKPLFYLMATDLYWRSQIETPEKLKVDAELFLKFNPIQSYQATVNSGYQIARLNNLDDAENVVDVSEYRIMEEPVILTKEAPTLAISQDAASLKEALAVGPFRVFSERNEGPILLDIVIKNQIHKIAANDAKEESEKHLEEQAKKKKEDNITVAVISKPTLDSTTKKEVAQVPPTATPVKTIAPPSNFIEIDNTPFQLATSSTSFEGSIKNPSRLTANFRLFAEPILYQEINTELKLDGKSAVSHQFDLAQPSLAELVYNKVTYSLYIEPGDQLNFHFSAEDHPNLYFTGKGGNHNNYLVLFHQKFADLKEELKDKINVATPNEFLDFMRKARGIQLEFLNSFPDQDKFSKGFLAYARAEIDYWYGFNLLNYPWEHPLYHNLDAPMKVPDNYYGFLRDISPYAEDALPNMNYTYYLRQFFDYQAEHYENEGLTELQLAEKYLHGDVLFYYKAKLLSISCKRGKAAKLGPDIAFFLEDCPNENYNNVLRQVYNEAKGLTLGSKAPDFTLEDINGKSVKLSDYQGKIVYLDFWASWCSPCVYQMKNSRTWKMNYKDKDVVFLYVSLDDKQEVWRSFVQTQGYEGIHVLAANGDVYQSQIAKLYKVKRMPAVFLIDKKGKVVYNSTKSGSGRVRDQIDNLLLSH